MPESIARSAAPEVRLGNISLSFHRATAAIIQRILEVYGHRVTSVEAPHEDLFRRQLRGEIDMLVSAWLPSSHGGYLAPYREQVRILGPQYEPYCIWAVPPYVPADLVIEVADLARLEVAERMTRAINGINPGAGISRFSARMVVDYGLDRVGYSFTPGNEAEFIARVERGIAKREWFVIPCWRPLYLNRVHRLRPLVEPKGLLGAVDAAGALVRHDSLARIRPVTIAGIDALRLGNDGIEKLDTLINVTGLTPLQAADQYLADHPELLPWQCG